MRGSVGILLVTVGMLGCQRASVNFARCVEMADSAAQRHIAEMNRSDDWAYVRKELAAPFALADYERTTVQKTLDGREVVGVIYDRREPLGIKGDPNGFRLHVYMDTGEAVLWTQANSGDIIRKLMKDNS